MKKKILWHSNYHKSNTGFGRNTKNILKYLAETGKYEIIEYATFARWGDPALSLRPWKCYGSLPPEGEMAQHHGNDPHLARSVQYGSVYIEEVIKKEKPDIYVGVEDIWAFSGYWHKPWWKKINSVLHVTLDSLPILSMAHEGAQNTDHFYVWAKFAEKAMHKLDYDHVKTLHGAFETDKFYKLKGDLASQIRVKKGIPYGAFVIGFVFRNQLRKSVPQLMEGFAMFSKDHPNAYLLLHTCWHESPDSSWDIPRLCREYQIDEKRILTTYVCRKCNTYHFSPYKGESRDCEFCGGSKSVFTTSSNYGVSDEALNEVYNVMDVYCHPFTSGGQEMPVQEAKLAELITCVTNYSCGEEYCTKESGGLPLEWSSYKEPSTQFIKASTWPESINEKLSEVYSMSDSKRAAIGKKARKFIKQNYDVKVIGRKWEEIIDNMPSIDWNFSFEEEKKNPDYEPSDEPDNTKWIQELYKNILNLNLPKEDKGVQDWLFSLKNGETRDHVLSFFKETARAENSKSNQIKFQELLDEDDEGRRIAIVMPQSAGDVLMTTSLLGNIKNLYPNHNLYYITSPQFAPIVDGNPHVHKVLPYISACDNLLWMEGHGDHKGFFEVCYMPHAGTQKFLDYLHNGKDVINIEMTAK